MHIGVIGQGFVGNAIFQKFKNFYNVNTYDLDPLKSNAPKEKVYESDIVFICLPTPMNKDGSCNTDLVHKALVEIDNASVCHTVVLKSTVVPGTTQRLNNIFRNIDIVYNPEFLTERNAVEDFNNQNRIILGGPRPATSKLKQIYSKVFPKAHIIKTGSTHAEMVKYFTNCFLATKVSFANEMYQLCDSLGLDYDKVVEYCTLDSRLGNSHWAVPGPDGSFGYGGHCFPKDLSALIRLCEGLDVEPTVLKAIQKKNNDVRDNRDWEGMKGRAVL